MPARFFFFGSPRWPTVVGRRGLGGDGDDVGRADA